jgi:hypothetical protein
MCIIDRSRSREISKCTLSELLLFEGTCDERRACWMFLVAYPLIANTLMDKIALVSKIAVIIRKVVQTDLRIVLFPVFAAAGEHGADYRQR